MKSTKTKASSGSPEKAQSLKQKLTAIRRALQAARKQQDHDEPKLDKIEKKLDKIERKLDKVEGKLDKIEAKLDSLEKKLDMIERKLDRLEKKLDMIEKKLDRDRPEIDVSSALEVFSQVASRLDGAPLKEIRATFDIQAASFDGGDLSGTDLDKLEKELDELERNLDGIERILDELEKGLDRAETFLDSVERFLDQFEKLLDDLERQLDGPRPQTRRRQSKTSSAAGVSASAETSGDARAGEAFPAPTAAQRRRARKLLSVLRSGNGGSDKAAQELEAMGPAATPALLEAYDAPEEHFRWEVVNLLGYTKDPLAIPLLADEAIHDPEIHPRWRSIWALTSVDDGSAAPRLRQALASERGRRRYEVAVALSLFEDPAAVPALRRGLTSKDAWDRWESASCLIGYGDEDTAQDILSRYPEETEADVRREMLRALAGVESPEVAAFLGECLADRSPKIRSAAAEALGRSSDGAARKLLEDRIAVEPNRRVLKEIRETLAAL